MARFHGRVGFYIEEDDQETGIPKRKVVEKPYYGRVLEHTRKWQTSDTVTEDLTFGNQIAIVANDYAFRNATAITHVEYMGSKWQVRSMRVKPPEIILTLGGVYNGPIKNGLSA